MSDGVARLLKEILIYRIDDGINKVAHILNETYDYVWSQTHERINPSIYVVKAAYEISKDPRLKRILEPKGMCLVPDSQLSTPTKETEAEATDVILSVSDLIKTVRNSMADLKISKSEAMEIGQRMSDVDKEWAEVKSSVRDLLDK